MSKPMILMRYTRRKSFRTNWVNRLFACLLFCASPLVAADAPPVDLQEGLLAHWKFQGDTKDSSGHGHDGTGRKVTFVAGPDGAPNGAAFFNGHDSVIEIADAESLRLGTDDFSLSVWVKPEAPMQSVFGDIVSKFDS